MQAHASPCKPISRDRLSLFSFAILICLEFVCFASTGCNHGLLKSDTTTNSDIDSVIFHGGYITADREHFVGFDLNPLKIPTDHRIQDIQSSCECVSAKLMTIESNQHKKPILQVTVHPDAKLTGIANLAVELRIKLSNQQLRSAVFEFVHYDKRAAIVE
ncbi:MAG: hypothetical protein ACK56W_02780 [Pirellula sp.]|jgi:hypothetical protein